MSGNPSKSPFFEWGGSLSANIWQGRRHRLPTNVGVRKLEWSWFHVVPKYPQSVIQFCHNTRVWQTDRRTDGRRDRIGTAIPCIAFYEAPCIYRRKVGVVLTKTFGANKTTHLFGFRRLWDLMANIFWTKHDIDNRARALESTSCQNSWSLVHTRLPKFYPPSVFCSVFSPSHTM